MLGAWWMEAEVGAVGGWILKPRGSEGGSRHTCTTLMTLTKRRFIWWWSHFCSCDTAVTV